MVTIPSSSKKLVKRAVKVALWLTLILPLVWIAYEFFAGGPSADPPKELNHLFGRVGFYALALNLSIGSIFALMKRLKRPLPAVLLPVVPYRRHLGVAGFLFLVVHVGFHFLIEAGLGEGFAAIIRAQYLWAGSFAFIGLFLLAVTSNDRAMRELGRKWKQLHRFVSLFFAAAVAHTLMIEKADLMHFGLIATVVGLPLAARVLTYLYDSVKRQKRTTL